MLLTDNLQVVLPLLEFLREKTNLSELLHEEAFSLLKEKLSLLKSLDLIDGGGSENVRVFREFRKTLVSFRFSMGSFLTKRLT